MVTLVKHEWHQCDVQYAVELDESVLSEIYPDLSEEEIAEKLQQIADGELDVDEIINDAYDNDVEIYWEHQYDDMWTMSKGGYEVTYELGDENSYHHEPEPPEPTHKCTKCKWVGQSYDAEWQWPEEDEAGEREAKKVCPMCDSDTELTEAGKQEQEARTKRMAEINEMFTDDEDTVDAQEVEAGLEELKREFEALTAQTDGEIVCPMRCTQCEWTGDWTDTVTDDDGDDTCPVCKALTVDVENP